MAIKYVRMFSPLITEMSELGATKVNTGTHCSLLKYLRTLRIHVHLSASCWSVHNFVHHSAIQYSRMQSIQVSFLAQTCNILGCRFGSVGWTINHVPHGWKQPARVRVWPVALCCMSSPLSSPPPSSLYSLYLSNKASQKGQKNIFKKTCNITGNSSFVTLSCKGSQCCCFGPSAITMFTPAQTTRAKGGNRLNTKGVKTPWDTLESSENGREIGAESLLHCVKRSEKIKSSNSKKFSL